MIPAAEHVDPARDSDVRRKLCAEGGITTRDAEEVASWLTIRLGLDRRSGQRITWDHIEAGVLALRPEWPPPAVAAVIRELHRRWRREADRNMDLDAMEGIR